MRTILAILILAGSLEAAVTVTCPTAQAGATVTCSASGGTGPYTWTLTAGSAGSINSSTGQYTAPATVTVQQKVGPCQMLPPDHIFNTRIDALPVDANSATIIGLGGSTTYHISIQPSWGQNIMDNTTGTFAAVFYYTPNRNGNFQINSWPNLYRESGVFTPPFSGVDRHVVGVNRETCEFSDIYNNYSAGDATAVEGCPLCTAQSGIKYTNSFQLPDTSVAGNGATDAASMYLQPLSIHLSDMQAGVIKHAIRMTMSNSWIKAAYQWPAEANAGAFCSGTCWQYGMYARLKSATDISGFSATAQIILLAMKNYGVIIADGGTSYGLQADDDIFQDPNVRNAMTEIINSSLRNGDLEVVDTSSLKISTYSGAVNLSNGYVTPAQFAEATATDSLSVAGSARVVLQGVVVGTPFPSMTIMAGDAVQLTAWVTGSGTTTVSWSMSPSVGTLSAAGLYTAPTGVTTPTTTRVTITSTAEATAVAYIDILVWPDADGNSGVIRMMPGKPSPDFTDGSSHKWWSKDYARVRGYGAPGLWNGGPAATVYSDTRYAYSDMTYRWWLPNGNYNLRMYTSINTGSGALTSSDFVFHYDINGTLAYLDKPVMDIVGTARFTGGYLDLPFTVTDGTAYFSIRNRTGANAYPSVSALEITPLLQYHSSSVEGSTTLTGGVTVR